MNLRIDNESVCAHIRETLMVPSTHTLLVGESAVTMGQLCYRISATVRIVPPGFRRGVDTPNPWIKISYEVSNVCRPT